MTEPRIRAITFDFFQTLAWYHPSPRGRGRSLIEFLHALGLSPGPFEHRMLYDVFAPFAAEYALDLPEDAKHGCYTRLADRMLTLLGIDHDAAFVEEHAQMIWELLGPASLRLYPEVHQVLGTLREAGFALAVISNYHRGLGHFCGVLGIAGYFDHIVASAEVGCAKPSREIFDEALRRLGVTAASALHVGDSRNDDVDGAQAAGMHAIHLDRAGEIVARDVTVVRSLAEIPALVSNDDQDARVLTRRASSPSG